YFIGNPLGFHGIANKGTIIDYTRLQNWDEDVIMMKAPVYRGSSGSPVINGDGEVIGVVFATTDRENYGKVGLFIPINHYWKYIDKSLTEEEGIEPLLFFDIQITISSLQTPFFG